MESQQNKIENKSLENEEPMIEMGAFNEKGELVDVIRVPAQPCQPESPRDCQEMRRQQQNKEDNLSSEDEDPMIEMGAFNEKGELVETIRVPAQPSQPEASRNWQEMHCHQQNQEDNHPVENEDPMIEMGAFNEKGELVDVIRVPAQPD